MNDQYIPLLVYRNAIGLPPLASRPARTALAIAYLHLSREGMLALLLHSFEWALCCTGWGLCWQRGLPYTSQILTKWQLRPILQSNQQQHWHSAGSAEGC
jgi:hypothetical protein